jgi:hypothetical protein
LSAAACAREPGTADSGMPTATERSREESLLGYCGSSTLGAVLIGIGGGWYCRKHGRFWH